MTHTHAHLFAGSGAWSLVLPGPSSWVAETDPHAWRVLAAHGETNVGDVRNASVPVHTLTAGFPCQPVSIAGRGLGAADDRWMWPVTRDIIERLAPAEVLLENVPGVKAYVPGIVADLADLGYTVAHGVFGACEVGARHHRHRWFAVARRVAVEAPAPRRVRCVRREGMCPTPMHRMGGISGGLPSPGAAARRATRGRGINLDDWCVLNDEGLSVGPRGGPVVDARWVEDLMMMPPGHVTDHVTNRAALGILGNGMVPAQARLAVDTLRAALHGDGPGLCSPPRCVLG